MSLERWEFVKENKKVRKKERNHALDLESDQENDQEKDKVFRLKDIDQFSSTCMSYVDSTKLNISIK